MRTPRANSSSYETVAEAKRLGQAIPNARLVNASGQAPCEFRWPVANMNREQLEKELELLSLQS